ncbi:MAG: hypothetical protein ACC662_02425, partial [Planctomycetota bacterium]
ETMEVEARVAQEAIARRLAGAFGLRRITTRLKERVGGLLFRAPGVHLGALGAEFLWRRDQDPARYDVFRVPAEGEKAPRHARHVPPKEIANAAAVLLHEHVGIAFEDLARETARVFGFRRYTKKVAGPMEKGVRLLLEQGGAVESNGRLHRPESPPDEPRG